MNNELHILNHVPSGLLECPASGLHRVLPGPTLLELPGSPRQPLFTCVLQHGNEKVGWDAVRSLLADYAGRELPRPWRIFIGNVAAARLGLRRLDGQPDFNRSWPGSLSGDTPVHRMLAALTDRMRRQQPFASVDVHNNTGRNPHYAAVNSMRPETLQLAALFSRTVLYFTSPNGVQSAAFEAFCPSLTVECGQVGAGYGVAHAREFLNGCLHLSEIPRHSPQHGDIFLYRTTARITVPANVSFGFDDCERQVNFAADLDMLNFRQLPAGARLARVADGLDAPVMAHDMNGREVTEEYFALRNGELVTARPVMPSMLTKDYRVIRQDCLGYFMETIEPPSAGR